MTEDIESLKKSEFLSNASKLLPFDSSFKLRSYLNTTSAILAENASLKLPDGWKPKSNICPHCYTQWFHGKYHVKLVPCGKRGKRARKLKSKNNRNKLNSFEKLFFSGLHFGNTLAVKCLVCTKTSKYLFEKPQKVVEIAKLSVKKKRRKKQNKFAGLREFAVETARKSSFITPSISLMGYDDDDDDDDDDIVVLEEKVVKSEKDDLNERNQSSVLKTNPLNLHTPVQPQKPKSLNGSFQNTPLGAQPVLKYPQSKTLDFIPIGKSKKQRKFVNPYATPPVSKDWKQGQKLQKLLAEEESKPKKNPLMGFLSTV